MKETFEQFKNNWREIEKTDPSKSKQQGTCLCGKMFENKPLTDEELLEIYTLCKESEATGLTHHGEAIGGGHVLELKGLGQ